MASKGKQREREGLSSPTKLSKEDEPLKVNKWDTAAVKNGLDDTVKKIMKDEYGCVEDHSLVDQRLALCTVACTFSLFALVYDYIHPFPESRSVLMVCSISYFILMGVVTLFLMFREGNIFLVALEKDEAGVLPDNVWTMASILPRFCHNYSLTVEFTDGQTKNTRKATIEKSVAEWFDEDGVLQLDKFFTEIKNIHSDLTKTKKDN